MMNRYGEYPVSLYTGLVDITIPIFEINVNGIKVPIEFKYHASGLKFDDMPMELGYGWTLIAGGTVSHSVRGTPDGGSFSGGYEKADPYVWVKDVNLIQKPQNTTSTTPDNDQSRLVYINHGVKYPFLQNSLSSSKYSDSEYDLYSYNIPNHTGQRYVLGDSYISVPANGFPVSPSGGGITDNDGITYLFTMLESESWAGCIVNDVWYLKKILSANLADSVVFNYSPVNSSVGKPVIDQRLEWKRTENFQGNGTTEHNQIVTGSGKITKPFNPPRLNYIQYRGGKIEFVYANTTTTSPHSRNLSEIKIYDHRNILYKTVKLNKTANGDWLNGVDFRDNANTIQQTYAFEYNDPPNTSLGIDYWGYYNGKTIGGNGCYLPNFNFPHDNYTIPGSDRSADATYMQRGILKRIVFPTKGYTIFDYEAHKAADNQIYGGLRIKEIRNYNPDGTLAEKKWYKYGTGESGKGRAARYIYNSTTFISEFCKRFLVVENGGSASAQYPIHQRHYYQYFYPFPLTSYFSSGSSVLYSEVAEYSGTGSASNGKTVYTYTDNLDQAQHATVRFNSQPLPYRSYEWKNGLLLSKKVYKNNSTAPIYSLINEYDYLLESEALNLGVAEYADIVDVDPTINYPSSVPHGTTHQLNAEEIKNNLANTTHGYIVPFTEAVDGSLFDYYNYYITTGLPVVKSSTETQDGISKTTFYDYNHLGLPTKVKAIDSRGGSISTRYKYPGDFNTAPYTAMANNHILSPVIQQEQYKNTSFLSKTVNEYKHWGNGMYEPEIIQFQASASDALTNRITYHNRDARGNPQYISKDGNDKVVYLWGYNYQYPVAKIENATYSDICKIVGNNNEATGKTALDNIAKKEEPVTADWTTINNLRTNPSLSNAMVTTYTYKPLVGIQTMTDPRGVKTTYEYDTFGRLQAIKDENGKTIENYNYHYKD
ncbi:hypothetical protein FACS189421_11700 [Bacteroidia bacterium]|nr:hypothetical protein FACS189421_11700 [Bacteroidia bacterium]